MAMPQVGEVRSHEGETRKWTGSEWELVQPDASQAHEATGDSMLMAGVKAVPGVVGNLALGVGKGAADTATSLGELVHKIPGVSSAVDALYGTPGLSSHAFKAAHEELKPEGTAQAIGKGIEQVGEFAIPGVAESPAGLGRIGKLALEGAKTAGVTGAQTAGDPRQMATSAVLGTAGGALGNLVESAPNAIRSGIGVKVADPRTAKLAKAAGESIDDPMWLKARNLNRQQVADLIKQYGLTGGQGDLDTIASAPGHLHEVLSAAHSSMDPAKRQLGHIWSLLAAGSTMLPGVGVGGHTAVALPLSAMSLAHKYPGFVAKGVDAAMPGVRGAMSAAAGQASRAIDPLMQELLARQEQP